MIVVSIIVPNYNHAPYLKQRMESIFNQTYQDFEVILLDDCSTDNSLEILQEYSKNPKVSELIANRANSGSTFLQWGRGIKLARGQYVWIAESDDWCEPSFLETLIDEFNRQPGIVLGYVQSYYMVGANDIKWISSQDVLEKTLKSADFIKNYLLYGNSIFNASMAVFKKSAYYNLSSDYENYKFCGDWFFWSEIAMQGSVFISGKVLNYFRNQEADVSCKAYSTGLNFVEELHVLFSFLDRSLITEMEFLSALNRKHINYRFTKKKFTTQVKGDIDSLFYNDKRTHKYKKILKQNFFKAIIVQKVKKGLKNITLWKKGSR
jgi:glycosyltransferase involved in cell wall biosynthesis